MAVSSTGVPLFAGIEDIDDMFMATMEEYDSEIMDELRIAHPFWDYLTRYKLFEMRSDISTHITVRRNKTRNPTVQWHSGYDDAVSTPASLLDEAKFAYGHITGRQMYNREELTKNSGRGQLVDLVEEKGNQVYRDVNEEAAATIIGVQDADGRKPLGLGRIMDESLACGNIDPASDATWKAPRIYKTGTTNFTLSTEFRLGMRKLYRTMNVNGAGQALRDKGQRKTGNFLLLCGEDVFDEHQKWAESVLQARMDEIKDSSGWGSAEMFDLNGKTIAYEPALAAKEAWFLNLDVGVRVRLHSGTNFTWSDWFLLPGKVQAKARDLLLYCAVYTKQRRANGRIVFN